MLATLDPGVRVVALMSQCYSGGFAELANARSTGELPDGSTCGYFSSTADRPAYGCYPENRGRDNVGHSLPLHRGARRARRLSVGARRGPGPRRQPGRAAAHLGRLISTTSSRAPRPPRAATRPRSSTRSCAQAWTTPEALRAGAAPARPHRPRVRRRRPALAARARRADDAHPRPRRAAPHPEHGLAGSARVRVARQRRSLPRRRTRPGSRASTSRRCAPSRPTMRARSPTQLLAALGTRDPCRRRRRAAGSRCCVSAPRSPARSPTAWTSAPASLLRLRARPRHGRRPRLPGTTRHRPTSGPPTRRCGAART